MSREKPLASVVSVPWRRVSIFYWGAAECPWTWELISLKIILEDFYCTWVPKHTHCPVRGFERNTRIIYDQVLPSGRTVQETQWLSGNTVQKIRCAPWVTRHGTPGDKQEVAATVCKPQHDNSSSGTKSYVRLTVYSQSQKDPEGPRSRLEFGCGLPWCLCAKVAVSWLVSCSWF